MLLKLTDHVEVVSNGDVISKLMSLYDSSQLASLFPELSKTDEGNLDKLFRVKPSRLTDAIEYLTVLGATA